MGMNYVGNAIFKLITFQNSVDLKLRTAKTGRNDKNRENSDAKPNQNRVFSVTPEILDLNYDIEIRPYLSYI